MATKISAENLSPITYNQIPVITTELLAQLYDTDPVRIRQNHSRNDDRFVAGKHYFLLDGDELRELKHRVSQSYSVKIARNVRSLILWTERGAARHAKMLETDQAWEVFEKLEDCYFSQRSYKPEPVLMSISYPLSWYTENYPLARMHCVDGTMVHINPNVIFDTPSPTMRILCELKRNGYEVEAAVAEVKALKHMMSEMRWALREIARMAETKSHAGLSFRL